MCIRDRCTTIYENAARIGTIHADTKLIKLEFSPTNSQTLLTKVFGKNNQPGLIDSTNHLVFMICNAQYMSHEFQEQLCLLLEMDKNKSSSKSKYKNKNIRYMLLSDIHPHLCMSERLLKNIPLILDVPKLQDKSKEEKEELIIHFIQNEGLKMKKTIKISSAVLRALVNGDYENNLLGLQSTIQLIDVYKRQVFIQMKSQLTFILRLMMQLKKQ